MRRRAPINRTHTLNITLTGRKAVVVSGLLIAGLFYRWNAISNSTDLELNKVIKQSIAFRTTSQNLKNFKAALAEQDHERAAELSSSLQDQGIDIKELKLSAPLFRLSNSYKVVVKATYALTDEPPKAEYFSCQYSWMMGWSYCNRSSAFSFYSNFF